MQPDDLEEGEIAMSGDSHMDLQQSGSWNHERDDGEDEQVLQPKIKRKRSIRVRPRPNAEKQEDRSGGEGVFPQRGTHLAFQGDCDYDSQFKSDLGARLFADPAARQQDAVHPIFKQKRNMPSKKVSPASRTGKLTYLSGSGEGSAERSKENWSSKAIDSASPEYRGTKMSDSMQRKVRTQTYTLCAVLHLLVIVLLNVLQIEWDSLEELSVEFCRLSIPAQEVKQSEDCLIHTNGKGCIMKAPFFAKK